MLRALLTAASGMRAQQQQVDTIANNIANVNTQGFKKNRLAFRSLLYATLREPGAPTSSARANPTGLQIGSGAEVSASTKVFAQGELVSTNRELDLSINGDGFFRVRLPGGEFRYTRNGAFRLDEQGSIVTPDGYPLDGAPTIPSDALSITVAEDGTVSFINSQDAFPGQLGQVQVFRFANNSGLKAQGGNYLSETASSGPAQAQAPGEGGAGRVLQGFLERSNVQTVEELVGLIVAQRNYEVNSRAIRVSDEMLQQTNQLIN